MFYLYFVKAKKIWHSKMYAKQQMQTNLYREIFLYF